MKKYQRNYATQLNRLLQQFPVVAIIGARQVGKTTLAVSIAKNFDYFDLEKPSDFDQIAYDTEFFFKEHPRHLILDEAQLMPRLFPILRGVIDQAREETGRFILTGSSSPELLTNISETLAGRVAIIELGTLKANEIYHMPLSPIYSELKKPLEKVSFTEVVNQAEPITSLMIKNAWVYGGYPEVVNLKDENFHEQWFANYQRTYINRDIAQLFPKLNKVNYRRFINMLSRLSGKVLNKSDLARGIDVTEPTIANYIEIAEGTFLWRQLQSFESSVIKSTVKMPRGHIRDSGLLHSLLRLSSYERLLNDPIVGLSFESFVIEEIIKGLDSTGIVNYDTYFYRTRGGAEVDLILEGNFGLLPIEIKFGSTIQRNKLRSLSQFIEGHQVPFGLVINQADKPLWLTEKILQIPVTYL